MHGSWERILKRLRRAKKREIWIIDENDFFNWESGRSKAKIQKSALHSLSFSTGLTVRLLCKHMISTLGSVSKVISGPGELFKRSPGWASRLGCHGRYQCYQRYQCHCTCRFGRISDSERWPSRDLSNFQATSQIYSSLLRPQDAAFSHLATSCRVSKKSVHAVHRVHIV